MTSAPLTLLMVLGATAAVALLALLTVLSRKGRSEDEARAYLAGVTYVLSGDPDAAVAELSRAAQLNRQTLETYFALGALFRRKGELDRAIRLHRNMLLRPGLSAEVRRRAQLALALDYKRSGLRDLAAETLETFLAEEPRSQEGLTLYRQVAEESHAWARACQLQQRLSELTGEGAPVLAHLLAEHARSLRDADPPQALERARQAVAADPRSADAHLALAEVGAVQGQREEAASALRSALTLQPELAPRTVKLFEQLEPDPKRLEAFLREQVRQGRSDGTPYELALALHFKERGQVEKAIFQLRRVVDRAPRFWEARRELGALLLEYDRSEELRADYQEILGALGKPAMGFACGGCRQQLPEHLFRCPSCESWDTVTREGAELREISRTATHIDPRI